MSLPPPDNAALQEFALGLQRVTLTRYLSGSGFVMLLYDHLLTLDQEVEDIWKAPWALPKYLFLSLRYVIPLTMIITTFQLNGHSDAQFCKVWLILSTAIGIVSIGCSNLLALLRLWVIWERNRRFMCWTFTGFVLTQLGATAVLISEALSTKPLIGYDPTLHLCVVTKKTHYFALWLPGVLFEVMVLTATFWNAFNRPRGPSTTLLSDLQRDGLFYFVVLALLRMANLTLAIVMPISLGFVGVFFIWCATTLTVIRLILNVRRMASEQRNSRTAPETLPENAVPMTSPGHWTESEKV